MRYIIDGYNLLFQMSFLKGTLEEKRDALLQLLSEANRKRQISLKIVFDAAEDEDDLIITHKGKIKVVFTAWTETADDYILHLIETSRKPSSLCVVTSDGPLKRMIRQYGTQVRESKDFLNYLFKLIEEEGDLDEKKSTFLPSLSGEPYPGYFFHLKEFEKRAKDEDNKESYE